MAKKQKAKAQVRQVIMRDSYKSIDLSALIATLPAYLTYRYVHNRYSYQVGLALVLGIFFVVAVSLWLLLGSWIRKRPDSRWNWFID
jgi:hypothetical protein